MDLETFDAIQKKHNHLAWMAIKHHRTHKGSYLDFKKHPYQKEIYYDQSDYIVIIKSTQNGISEYLLVRAISSAIQGRRVFYVLPTFDLVKRAVDERYTKSVQQTPYYQVLSKVARDEMGVRQTDSVKSKDIGEGNIAYVNSFSKIGFTEYPADEVIIDELDRCDQVNIEMAWERMSASDYQKEIKISNPTFVNTGIDKEYRDTDQMEWFVRCSSGHRVRLDWFRHVVEEIDDGRYVIRDSKWNWNSNRDIYPVCKCGKYINRKSDGEWISKRESHKRGRRLTKLFTGNVTLIRLLDRFKKGLIDDEIMQRFYNADLGEAYTAKGSKLSDDSIFSCIKNYGQGPEKKGLIVAGIDVGKFYHIIINSLLPGGVIKTICINAIKETKEVIFLLKKYNVQILVIDGLPETRESRKIAYSVQMGFLCYFGNIKNDTFDPLKKTITVQRTPALDAVKEAVLTNTVVYPHNTKGNKEFISHMTASTRAYNPEKRTGQQTGAYEWINNGPDHYFLASAYSLIARRIVVLLNRG